LKAHFGDQALLIATSPKDVIDRIQIQQSKNAASNPPEEKNPPSDNTEQDNGMGEGK
jgi:hypothetical protein